MTVYSHSVLEAWDLCPLQGYHALVSPRVEKAGPARQGQAGHAVAMLYTQHLHAKQVVCDVEEGERIVRKVCAKLHPRDAAAVESDLLYFVSMDFPWVLEATAVEWETRRFFTLDGTPVPADEVHTVHEPLFGLTPDVWWMDRDDRLHVIDYKFGRNPSHVDHPEVNLQLRRYGAALAQMFTDIEEVVGHLVHGRYGYEDEPATFDRDQLREAWLLSVVDPVKRLEAALLGGPDVRRPQPVLGTHCPDCDWRWSCEAFVRAPTAPELETTERAVEILHILGAKTKELRARVKKAVGDAGGLVEAGTHAASISVQVSYDFDSEKLRAALATKLTDDQVEAAFSASKTSILEAMKAAGLKPKDRRAWLEELITSCARRTTASERIDIKRRAKSRPRPGVEEEEVFDADDG